MKGEGWTLILEVKRLVHATLTAHNSWLWYTPSRDHNRGLLVCPKISLGLLVQCWTKIQSKCTGRGLDWPFNRPKSCPCLWSSLVYITRRRRVVVVKIVVLMLMTSEGTEEQRNSSGDSDSSFHSECDALEFMW